MDAAAQLARLDRPVRRGGVHRACPRVAGCIETRRGTRPHQGAGGDPPRRGSRSLRRLRPGAPGAADRDGSLLRRADHSDAAEPRAGSRRRRHPPRSAARGLPAAAVGVEIHLSSLSQAVESAPCGATHGRPVPLRVREHRLAGRIGLLPHQAGDPGARATLLLIAGGHDHIVPSSVVYENFTRYRRSAAPTDFKLFEDRPHLTAALDGWSDVADYALTWTAGRSG